MKTNKKILELINVNKFYKIGKTTKFQALNSVDLSFEKGELVSILGESGSGKSTLMNLIGGLDSDFSGSILIEGENINNLSEKELDRYRKNKIGFIFQSFNLIQHLSILDNVTIAMTLSNVNRKERTERATEILKEVGLEGHLNKKPNQLSGGQKQRVAIARALINDPEVILADEPTGSLDSKTSEQILKIIKKIAKKGKLIIMVTHSNHVAKISTRTIKISDGKITEDKEIREKVVFKDDGVDLSKEKQNLSLFSAMGLSLRNMKEKILRNILVSLGASIGIMSVIIMLSIGQGVENYLVDSMNENVNPLVVEVSMTGEENGEDGIINMQQNLTEILYFEEENIEELSKLKNVEKVELGFSVMAPISKVKMGEIETGMQMLYTASSMLTSNNIAVGEIPIEEGVLISDYIASNLDEEYENLIGKEIEITVQVGETVIKETVTISGVMSLTGMKMMDESGYMYISYEELDNLFQKYDLELEPTIIYLISDSEENASQLKDKVAELGYSGSMQDMMLGIFTEMLDVVTYILAAIAGISLFVSAIMILVVMYISVVERTKEIGVLKAIGARRKDIKRIFTTEALLIGFFGGILGVLVATLLSLLINSIVQNLFEASLIAYVPKYMIFGLLISIFISVVAGLFPSAKAAKLDPIESLRHE